MIILLIAAVLLSGYVLFSLHMTDSTSIRYYRVSAIIGWTVVFMINALTLVKVLLK